MSRPKKLRNISRVKANPKVDRATGGWLVRFTRAAKITQVYFGDFSLGGKAGSLQAAIAERDRLEQKLKPTSARWTERLLDPKRGISLRRQNLTRNGRTKVYEFAEAVWSDRPGHVVNRRFSVAKFGKKGALALARDTRRAAIKSILERRK